MRFVQFLFFRHALAFGWGQSQDRGEIAPVPRKAPIFLALDGAAKMKGNLQKSFFLPRSVS